MGRIFGFMMLCFLVLSFGTLQAEEKKLSADKGEALRAEINRQADEAKADLNGSEWEISVKPSSKVSKSIFSSNDTLTFQNNRFQSEQMTEEGFRPTNYTVTVPEDKQLPVVWETMQTSSEGEVMFWRGEWNREKNLMSGTIVRQLEEGNEDYYFTSVSAKDIPPTSEPAEEGKEEVLEAEPLKVLGASEPQESKKKAKKGWF